MSLEHDLLLSDGGPPPPSDTVLPPLGALEILAASTEPFVFLDGSYRVRYVNPAAERYFGHSAASMYGRQPWDGWPSALGERAEHEYRRAMSEQVSVVFNDRQEGEGGAVHIEVTAYPAAGGLAVFIHDVTRERQGLEEAQRAATSLWEESAELENRNTQLTRANASLDHARHDAERAAERAAERMRVVADSAGDIVFWHDAHWRSIFLNEAGHVMLARLGRQGEHLGHSLWEALPQLLGTKFESETRRAASERRLVQYEEFLPDTGQWLEGRAVPLSDGTLLTFLRDVTERHRRLEELEQSEVRHRGIIEAASQIVWMADADGQMTDMPFWRELTGQTLEEVRGAGWVDAIHPDDASLTTASFRAAVGSHTTFEAQFRLRLREGIYRWYRGRGVPVHNVDGTVREWVGSFNEVDRMIRRDDAMRFLVGASTALTETLDVQATLDTLARLAVDHFADGAMVTLLREDGSFEHVATCSRDGITAAYAAETERLYPLLADSISGYPRAIRTGKPELIPAEAFQDDILPRIATDATHLARLRKLDMYSAMVVPLVVRGSAVGAITLVLHGTERRQPFDATDLALATELGRRAALALDNARLFDGERRARQEAALAAERLSTIANAARAFALAATDPVRISEALANVLVERIGDMCVIRVLGADEESLRAVTVRHRDASVEPTLDADARSTVHRLDDGLIGALGAPGSYILRSSGALDDGRALMEPAFGSGIDAGRIHAALGIALRSETRIVGTAFLARDDEERPYDASDVALVQDLSGRAALLLERAQLFAAERSARAEAERAAELTRRMQEITVTFARTVTVNDVAATTLSHGLDALSAHSGVVYLMNETGDTLDLVRREGVADDTLRAFQHLPLAVAMPVTDAVREGEIVYLGERSTLVDRYPGIASSTSDADAWVAIPLLHGGRILGAIALAFRGPHEFTRHERALLDTLGRHCAQAMERARLLDSERDARDDAERANLAKSDLLAKVSHETRQPVHASIGWVDTLEMELHGPITDAQHEALRRIKQNQLRLLTVLNDLLDMSRIEAGRLDVRMHDVVVADVVDAVESAVTPQMRGKRIRFSFSRPAPEVRVNADVDQLIGILTNLLSNAAKFTPEGGDVTVTCEVGPTDVCLAVRDTGIGIPAHLAGRVFEPFFQVESGFTRTTVGTGLGLAISREAARAMGGEVSVESEVGKGSCFTVRLQRSE